VAIIYSVGPGVRPASQGTDRAELHVDLRSGAALDSRQKRTCKIVYLEVNTAFILSLRLGARNSLFRALAEKQILRAFPRARDGKCGILFARRDDASCGNIRIAKFGRIARRAKKPAAAFELLRASKRSGRLWSGLGDNENKFAARSPLI
jgi:hypothetical protein